MSNCGPWCVETVDRLATNASVKMCVIPSSAIQMVDFEKDTLR